MDHAPKLRIAVMASGSGSNLQAVIDRCADGTLHAEVVLVISNNRDSVALRRAEAAGIKALHWSEKAVGSSERFAAGLIEHLRAARTDLVVLAGYMKLVPPAAVAAFSGRILNIHPALLPRFGGKGYYGIRVHQAVLAAGEKETGATVHVVDDVYDRGPIVMQRRVPVMPGDTPERLRERVLEIEHQLLPEAIAHWAQDRTRAKTE